MNPDSNHLVNPSMLGENLKQIEQEELMKALSQQGYKELPENLQHAAKVKLNGRSEAYVSKNSGGKLSKWAANIRQKIQRNR